MRALILTLDILAALLLLGLLYLTDTGQLHRLPWFDKEEDR